MLGPECGKRDQSSESPERIRTEGDNGYVSEVR